jgi:glyoxylase-like metal-dependent hydrolase (beta-lactamase superfamily II)
MSPRSQVANFIVEDVDALGDMIASTGKRLTAIFITHGHLDHFVGSDRLIARFPGARVVTTPGIVDYINAHIEDDAKFFAAMFGDTVAKATSRPSRLEGDVIALEGHELRVIEVGQGDIAPSAVLHIPSLEAVVAGDVAYNQIHQMLGLGGPAEWDKWIASVAMIERLHPRIVVAGHKKPEAPDDEAEKILNGTRSYIQDFKEAARSLGTVEEIVAAMQSKYPDHGNITTLLFSARAAVKARAS